VISARRLKTELHYDPYTGVFVRLQDKSRRVTKHYPVGNYTDSKGHRMTVINYRKYKLSYLAHLYVTGVWPKRGIRYFDGDKRNLRWGNLSETGNRIANYF